MNQARQAHGHDHHNANKELRRMQKEMDKLKKMEHRLLLEKQKNDHERVQLEQKKLAMEHNKEMHASHDKMITELRRKLDMAESKLKRYDGQRGKVYLKIIEKVKHYPDWIDKVGWEHGKAKRRILEIIKEWEDYENTDEADTPGHFL